MSVLDDALHESAVPSNPENQAPDPIPGLQPDFTVKPPAEPAKPKEPESVARKMFGDDPEKAYRAYDELYRSYHDEKGLAGVKGAVRGLEERLAVLDKLSVLEQLPAVLEKLAQPRAVEQPKPQAPQSTGFKPQFSDDDMYDGNSMSAALAREFEKAMSARPQADSQSDKLDKVMEALTGMQKQMDEKLQVYTLEQEKAALLKAGVPEATLRLAGVYADEKTASFSEALERLYKDFPALRPEVKPAPAFGLPNLPRELAGGQHDQVGDAMRRFVSGIGEHRNPSDIIATTRR